MSLKEMREYLAYLLWLVVFIFVVYLIADGPSKIAYEAGRAIASFRTGFIDGSATATSSLNQVFPAKQQ